MAALKYLTQANEHLYFIAQVNSTLKTARRRFHRANVKSGDVTHDMTIYLFNF